MLIEIFFCGWRSQLELVATGHLLQQVNLFLMDMPHLVLVKGPLIMVPLVALPWAGLMAAPPLLLQPSSASTACTGLKPLTRSPKTTVTPTWETPPRALTPTPPTTTPHRRPLRRCCNAPPPPSPYAYCCASGTS